MRRSSSRPSGGSGQSFSRAVSHSGQFVTTTFGTTDCLIHLGQSIPLQRYKFILSLYSPPPPPPFPPCGRVRIILPYSICPPSAPALLFSTTGDAVSAMHLSAMQALQHPLGHSRCPHYSKCPHVLVLPLLPPPPFLSVPHTPLPLGHPYVMCHGADTQHQPVRPVLPAHRILPQQRHHPVASVDGLAADPAPGCEPRQRVRVIWVEAPQPGRPPPLLGAPTLAVDVAAPCAVTART